MHRKLAPGLVMAAALVLVAHAPPILAQTCGPRSMSVVVDESAQYIITQCPATPEAIFKVLDPGAERVASIVLTDVEGSEGTFRIDGVAPGETTFKLQFRAVVPPQRTGVCNLTVAVTSE